MAGRREIRRERSKKMRAHTQQQRAFGSLDTLAQVNHSHWCMWPASPLLDNITCMMHGNNARVNLASARKCSMCNIYRCAISATTVPGPSGLQLVPKCELLDHLSLSVAPCCCAAPRRHDLDHYPPDARNEPHASPLHSQFHGNAAPKETNSTDEAHIIIICIYAYFRVVVFRMSRAPRLLSPCLPSAAIHVQCNFTFYL